MTFISTLDNISTPADAGRTPQPNEAALRQAAAQFESLLLTQLTSSLNPKDEDEEGLFSNSGGGMGIARQMYSEQLAKTMSESGGIGIAEMIVSQVLKRNAPHRDNRVNGETARALSAGRDIRNQPAKSYDGKAVTSFHRTTDRSLEARLDAEVSSAGKVAQAPAALGSALSSDDARTASSVTRPRRVHAVEKNSMMLRPEIARPKEIAAAMLKHPRHTSTPVAFHAPLSGEIRSQFGMRRDPINGRMRLHQGIDIAAKSGTPISAAAAGTVMFAGRNKGYGNMVMIEHADGRQTLYAHAERLFVKPGDAVAAGQTIAAVGSTGHSTGPHLHFEVRESNRAVNPLTSLSKDIAFARR